MRINEQKVQQLRTIVEGMKGFEVEATVRKAENLIKAAFEVEKQEAVAGMRLIGKPVSGCKIGKAPYAYTPLIGEANPLEAFANSLTNSELTCKVKIGDTVNVNGLLTNEGKTLVSCNVETAIPKNESQWSLLDNFINSFRQSKTIAFFPERFDEVAKKGKMIEVAELEKMRQAASENIGVKMKTVAASIEDRTDILNCSFKCAQERLLDPLASEKEIQYALDDIKQYKKEADELGIKLKGFEKLEEFIDKYAKG